MKMIKMHDSVGDFAENKDIARRLREQEIMPALYDGFEVVLDFENVKGATQSFIHALISQPIRELKNTALDQLFYKHANGDIREIISIVYRYMQESLDDYENK